MTVLFNNAFFAALDASPLVAGTLGVALLHRSRPNPPETGVSNLLDTVGFQEAVATGYARLTPAFTLSVSGGVTTVNANTSYEFANTVPVYVSAVCFYYVGTKGGMTNPWIALVPVESVWNPETRIYPAELTRVFAYLTDTPEVNPVWYVNEITYGPAPWEPTRVTKVYMLPQRVNYAINPTFKTDLFGWRASSALTRQTETGREFGRIAAAGTIESLPVPIPNQVTTVRLDVRSQGATTVQLNVLMYDDETPSGASTRQTGRTFSFPLAPGGQNTWHTVQDYIVVGDRTNLASIEVDADGSIDIDNVLWATGYAEYPYFDGDSYHSHPGDFSWRGTAHESMSFWYNNRDATSARLFGTDGVINEWLPVGGRFQAIWDVLYEGDLKHPEKNWSSILIP